MPVNHDFGGTVPFLQEILLDGSLPITGVGPHDLRRNVVNTYSPTPGMVLRLPADPEQGERYVLQENDFTNVPVILDGNGNSVVDPATSTAGPSAVLRESSMRVVYVFVDVLWLPVERSWRDIGALLDKILFNDAGEILYSEDGSILADG